jgi:hypothetical protein
MCVYKWRRCQAQLVSLFPKRALANKSCAKKRRLLYYIYFIADEFGPCSICIVRVGMYLMTTIVFFEMNDAMKVTRAARL